MPALVFGREGACPRCGGRGWTAKRPDGTSRPAYPSELRDYAAGKAPAGTVAPCRRCGASGVVTFRYA